MADGHALYDGLSCLYGAVAAAERGDVVGWEILRSDLPRYFTSDLHVLATIAYATLDRLDAVADEGLVSVEHDDISSVAHALVTSACSYGIAQRPQVRAAAARLDVVRRASDQLLLATLEAADPDKGIPVDGHIDGAIALLAATVTLWARRTGQSPRRAASDLCLAASCRAVLP